MKKKIIFLTLLISSAIMQGMNSWTESASSHLLTDVLAARNSEQFLRAATRYINAQILVNPILEQDAIIDVTELIRVIPDRNERKIVAKALQLRMDHAK